MSRASLGFGLVKLKEALINSLSEKTLSQYISDWKTWDRFRSQSQFTEFTSESELFLYFLLKHMKYQNSVATLKRRVAGISFFLKLFGRMDFTKTHLVKQILKELYLYFFAALRVSEVVAPSKIKTGGLQVEDLIIVEGKLKIVVNNSKTDKKAKGLISWLGPLCNNTLCPIKAFREFAAIRPKVTGPFFLHQDGKFVSRYQFASMQKMCFLLKASFRIRAATQAALLGFNENTIKTIGCWESARYKLYVRPNMV
ncbi:hypothetical protein XELAEV_18027092mg [Xenopus laevis]|uniref:Core-binding (CB) domain-containing protein n=1 Tax=Xenopus laevis TaxID=8355 RepID=A0A974CUW2_XENLA|nr:hypothetical protein XELAEV_18027092mg [Xenopus laevis]